MTKNERENKLKELRLELVKAQANASKGGTSKIKNTKKIIAKMITINKLEENKKTK